MVGRRESSGGGLAQHVGTKDLGVRNDSHSAGLEQPSQDRAVVESCRQGCERSQRLTSQVCFLGQPLERGRLRGAAPYHVLRGLTPEPVAL